MASNDNINKALLPAGLRDMLPPEADRAADLVERLRQSFAGHGYRMVKPPLIEFEESMLEGPGAALTADTFRLMDPISQRMMGLRSDITVQIARIATTRLAGEPRPLRLTYAGDVLRVKGTQLRPERQFGQVGAELIGADGVAADAEAILVAVEALRAVGVEGLTVDLSVPRLVPLLCQGLKLNDKDARALRAAFDRKDAAAVARAGESAGASQEVLTALMRAAGDAAQALAALEVIKLPGDAKKEAQRLAEVVTAVAAAEPALHLTVDPVEHRGFEYHTGVSFTIFKAGVRGELGSGGRYEAVSLDGPSTPEPATGFTLYTDTVLRALPDAPIREALFMPWGTPWADGAALREAGWRTVAAVAPHGKDRKAAAGEAARLGCSHLFWNGEAMPLGKDSG